jgi:hypothetical protein
LLNDIDEKMTSNHLEARLVCIAYHATEWPPIQERLVNQKRFILMFAPITRKTDAELYHSFLNAETDAPLPPYHPNTDDDYERSEEYIPFIRKWREVFDGETINYDYYLMWRHYRDPSYMKTARLIYDDLRGYKRMGFDGLISCQVQRAAVPTGLPIYVMANTLWNTEADFETLVTEYFEGAFGKDYRLARDYLEKISDFFAPSYYGARNWGQKGMPSTERKNNSNAVARRMREAQNLITDFRETVYAHIGEGECDRADLWRNLIYHGFICLLLSQAMLAEARDDDAGLKIAHEALIDYVKQCDKRLGGVLDTAVYISTLNNRGLSLYGGVESDERVVTGVITDA